MAEAKTIRLYLFDSGGGIDKAISAVDALHLNDTITWLVKDEAGRGVSVFLRNFKPPFVRIDSALPLGLDNGGEGEITGTVIKAPGQGKHQKVTYNVYAGSDLIDPDLIIDGDPINVPPTKKGKAEKKGGKKTGGKKKAGKKR